MKINYKGYCKSSEREIVIGNEQVQAVPTLGTIGSTLAFRPIVSNIGTASYKLARFLSRFLAHLTCNNLYTVKNSYDFMDKLKLISLSNYAMLSLDVKSHFLMLQFKGR